MSAPPLDYSGSTVDHERGQNPSTVAPIPEEGFEKYRDGTQLVEIVTIVSHRRYRRGYRLTVRFKPTDDEPTGELSELTASSLQRTAPELLAEYARVHTVPTLLPSSQRTWGGCHMHETCHVPTEYYTLISHSLVGHTD
ncbi:hypothetical protein PVL30_002638 [Lodderomyces elongisporus]|uniref:uncharacterized protein n=1 Tax=Lodderomyces elongisporus TaxID=36914 RepID=UPI0029218D2A|nr:uncharacterized protein PVL30_002638 [Lodderomyces elongisporus]WLF78891.1 hypothetical protein PVL30_002638 [Lodderomyces elongisporus]